MEEITRRQLHGSYQQGLDRHKEQLLSKVPEVTVFFWIIKVLCTTVGETASDFLNVNLGFGLTGTSIVMGILLGLAFFFQFRAKKYIAINYWLTVVLISIFGTLVTDNMTDQMGIPLEVSTLVFSAALGITFAVWYTNEKTLSIHSIFTVKREVFYWLTILFTFALGTASGDLMAESLGLGYLTTGIIVCVVIGAVAVAWKLKLDAVLSFWIAYIMTRPLGASFGDLLTQPPKYGGLGLGATVTTVIFISAIGITVAYLAITKKDLVPAKAPQQPNKTAKRGLVLVQVAAVICIMAVAGGFGYYTQHTKILSDAQTQVAQALPQTDSGSGAVSQETSGSNPADLQQVAGGQASQTTQPAGSAAVAPSAAPKVTALGDLSSFITIESSMLSSVNTGDMFKAKSGADDLEYTWDQAEAKLKPKDPATWTKVDTTIDTVLRQVRSVNPDPSSCKKALEASIAAMQ